MANATYFKLMGFGPHTRLSLYMLLKHKALFFAYKNVLNDPTDCSPYFYVDIDDSNIEKRVKEVSIDTENESTDVIRDALQVLDIFEQERIATQEKKSIPFRTRYFRWGSVSRDKKALDIAREFIAHHMRLQVDEARIFSMSKRHDEPRLWAHYANSHTGLCLELDGVDDKQSAMILDRVDYTTRRPRISVSDLKGMKHSEKNKSEIYNRMFFQKSTGWDYEVEQRLVIPRVDMAKNVALLRFPEGDYIPFSKLKVKTIYFGMNCDYQNISMVQNLVKQFCGKSKPDMQIAEQSEDNYDIKFSDINDVFG